MPSPSSRAAEIVPPNVAELSVLYNEHADKWIMTYLDENLDIVLRSADAPEGPWSASQAISTFADHPGLYGGFLHPSSTGEDLYLAMTQWDPYNVYLVRASIDEDANLVRPNLVQDPSFERTPTTALGSSWGCLAPCGADNSHAWGMAGNNNAWLRYNSGWRDLYQTIAVEPNTEYELRMWLRTGGATDPGFYGVRETDDTAAPIAEGIFFNIPAWTEYRVAFDSGVAHRGRGVRRHLDERGRPLAAGGRRLGRGGRAGAAAGPDAVVARADVESVRHGHRGRRRHVHGNGHGVGGSPRSRAPG